ncbi:hypothetical protein DPMN_141268 [Dreissena polymorpha]|uniref:Secreted protein n=1 Tax=Dreissena polymorpha TaxID=45954 RepID=A0A9D4JMG5_DREPO|nr:hypothetical protein DPMN_141268 [Dreissena polymorpha]
MASFLLAILTSGNTSAHVRGPGSKRAWSAHQASASIPLAPHHAAWSRHMNDANRVPFTGGVALALHSPHFSLFGTTPYSQRNRPTECHSQSATDVPSHPRKYIDYLSYPSAPFVSKEGAFAMQRTLKPLRPSRPVHPKEVY